MKGIYEYLEKGLSLETSYTRLKHNNKMKNYRIRKRLNEWIDLDLDVAFVTLTLTEYWHSKLNETTVKRYAKEYLKSHFMAYIANIEYSPEKNRLHVHAIVAYSKTFTWDCWIYGMVNIKVLQLQDYLQVLRYIIKLSAHTTKAKTIAFSSRS